MPTKEMNYQFVFDPKDPNRLHIPKNLIDLTLEPWQKLPACHGKNRGLRVGDLQRTKKYTLKQIPGRLCPDCLAEAEANGLTLPNYDRGIVYEEPFDESPLLLGPPKVMGSPMHCPECKAPLEVYLVGPVHR